MNKIITTNGNALKAVLAAVQNCQAKPLGDPQRIIVLLAPPGFALPPLYRQALRHRGAVLVPAGTMDRNRVRFLKLLAHRTRVVPVLLAGAEDWRNWNRRQPLAAAQIRRRTVMVTELEAPSIIDNCARPHESSRACPAPREGTRPTTAGCRPGPLTRRRAVHSVAANHSTTSTQEN
jgi:hypothetical protein